MHIARFAHLVLILSTFLFLTSCSGGGDEEGARGGSLSLAAVLPTSGPNAAVGREAADAVRMAVEEWSPRFEEKGWKLTVNIQDDASDPKQAMSAAYAVTGDPDTFGVVAHYNSGCFLPATEVYHSAGTMAISPATTNVEITQKGFDEIARVTPHDGVQGELTADFVRSELGLTRIAVVHDRTQYGQGLAEVFRDHGTEVGLEIVSFDGIQVGDKDFKALLTKVRESSPEAMYFGGLYDEAGFLVKQMRELGMDSVFISDDGSFGQDFFDVGGSATEGAILSFPGTPIDKLEPAQDFLAAFEAKYSRPVQNYGPYAYDSANILLSSAMSAIEGGADSSSLRRAVVDKARAIEHSGTLGVTKFDSSGDTLNQRYSFYRVEDASFVYVATATQGGSIERASDGPAEEPASEPAEGAGDKAAEEPAAEDAASE